MVCGDLICDKGERTQSTDTEPTQILMIPQEVDFRCYFFKIMSLKTQG